MLEVVRPMVKAIAEQTHRLLRSVEALQRQPSPAKVRDARRALSRAMPVWKRAYAFRTGPLSNSNAFQKAAFWPARPHAVRAIVLDTKPLGPGQIEALGADARGLFALEYLLFDRELSELLSGDGQVAARSRLYALGLAASALSYARRMQAELADGRAYALSFARAGQASVELLSAQGIDSVDMLIGKFDRVKRAHSRGEPLFSYVEGYFSRSSLAVVQAFLDGVEQLYRGAGGGLSELVRSVAPDIDEHVRSDFAGARRQLTSLGVPLERGIASAPAQFEAAAAALRELRHTLRVEVASALEG